MKNMSARIRPLAVLLVACAAPGLMAQQSNGSFSGRVVSKDSGAPMGRVVVSAEQKGTSLTRRTVTDSEGNFKLPALPVGEYKVTFSQDGQNHTVRQNVSLGIDTFIAFKFPSMASAVVVVQAQGVVADTINTTSAEIGVNVTSAILTNLPVIDRNVNSAAVLAPGVQIIQGAQVDPTKKTSTYIVSGDGQGRGTNFTLDGADNNSSDVGGYVMPVPFDAIDQFAVVTNQYKAEYGRSNAGFLSVVTKSGSNEFHGLANYQFQNDSLRARRTDESPKQKDDQSTYSALVSGPLMKDKLFYMVAYEGNKSNAPSYPFDPRAIAVYPELGGLKNVITKDTIYAKIDWNASDSLLVSLRAGNYKDKSTDQSFSHTDAVKGYVSPSMLGTSKNETKSFGGKLTYTQSSFVFESNLGYFDYSNTIRPSSDGPGLGTALQVRSFSSTNNPVKSKDAWRTGLDPNATQGTGIKRLQWKNEITYLAGSHDFKGGVDYQDSEYVENSFFYKEPTVYSVRLAGVAFGQEWGQGVKADQNVIGVALSVPVLQPANKYKQYGIYLQDDWTLSPKLSVYLGARLDFDTQLEYMKQFNGLYAQIHAANPQLAGIGSEAPKDKKYFSPRIQLLYKPREDDSLTFKFGAGRFVANTIDNVVGFSRTMMAPVNGLTSSVIYNNAARTYQGNSTDPTYLDSFKAGTVFTTVNGTPLVLPADLTPYNYAHNVNGLRDLFRVKAKGLLTAANFGSGGKNLLGSDFRYPQTDTLTLGMTWKLTEHSNLDMTMLYSKTKYSTVQFVADASAPQVTSLGAGGEDMGDTIFMSNQTASTKQLQVKYTYTTSKLSLLATMVLKDNKSSYGGSGGAFDASGGADFYGSGAQLPWLTGAERRAHGSERVSGSFSFNYKFDTGTLMGLLGQWHSGKAYDVYLGWNESLGPKAQTDVAHPSNIKGYREGAWNLDLGLRVSHPFTVAKVFTVEPYLQVSNLLNNYDYGSNYNSVMQPGGTPDPDFGQRGRAFQINNPRTAAFGVRMTF